MAKGQPKGIQCVCHKWPLHDHRHQSTSQLWVCLWLCVHMCVEGKESKSSPSSFTHFFFFTNQTVTANRTLTLGSLWVCVSVSGIEEGREKLLSFFPLRVASGSLCFLHWFGIGFTLEAFLTQPSPPFVQAWDWHYNSTGLWPLSGCGFAVGSLKDLVSCTGTLDGFGDLSSNLPVGGQPTLTTTP